jgi:hypothetical protein
MAGRVLYAKRRRSSSKKRRRILAFHPIRNPHSPQLKAKAAVRTPNNGKPSYMHPLRLRRIAIDHVKRSGSAERLTPDVDIGPLSPVTVLKLGAGHHRLGRTCLSARQKQWCLQLDWDVQTLALHFGRT